AVGRGGCLLVQVVECVDDLVAVIVVGDERLLLITLMRRGLPAIGQAIGYGEGWFETPSVLNEETLGPQRRMGDEGRPERSRLQIAVPHRQNAHAVHES